MFFMNFNRNFFSKKSPVNLLNQGLFVYLFFSFFKGFFFLGHSVKCIYHAFISHVSRYSLDQKKVSSRSRLGHSRVSVSSRTVWQTSRSRLGLGSSGLGLGLGLDPEGLEPIPVCLTYCNARRTRRNIS